MPVLGWPSTALGLRARKEMMDHSNQESYSHWSNFWMEFEGFRDLFNTTLAHFHFADILPKNRSKNPKELPGPSCFPWVFGLPPSALCVLISSVWILGCQDTSHWSSLPLGFRFAKSWVCSKFKAKPCTAQISSWRIRRKSPKGFGKESRYLQVIPGSHLTSDKVKYEMTIEVPA